MKQILKSWEQKKRPKYGTRFEEIRIEATSAFQEPLRIMGSPVAFFEILRPRLTDTNRFFESTKHGSQEEGQEDVRAPGVAGNAQLAASQLAGHGPPL